MALTEAQRRALGIVSDLSAVGVDTVPADACVTPGTLRSLERRGLITCSRLYATDGVEITPAGRAALSEKETTDA